MSDTPAAAEARYSLPEGVLNATLSYLSGRPFNEVAQIIGAIQHSAQKIELLAEADSAAKEKTKPAEVSAA